MKLRHSQTVRGKKLDGVPHAVVAAVLLTGPEEELQVPWRRFFKIFFYEKILKLIVSKYFKISKET